jgi:hypothetical protein
VNWYQTVDHCISRCSNAIITGLLRLMQIGASTIAVTD